MIQELRSRIRDLLESIQTSLWFIPALSVVGIMILSYVLLLIDRSYARFISAHLPWLFSGTPGAARSLLSSIASSVITVISIAFSLTIVAMQQASAQYTPRVLRTFTSDRGNQIVLGAYIATFVYALLILRAVRESENGTDSFVPSVSASAAVLFVLICMGLLIYFIDHIATSLQATMILSRVHTSLLEQLNELYPEALGEPARGENTGTGAEDGGRKHVITSWEGGFIMVIDEESLLRVRSDTLRSVHILPRVGDFVTHGEPIGEVFAAEELPAATLKKIKKAVTIGKQRSAVQDPLYVIRQLVDTALKGLSPGVNDPTTAEYCIRFLGDALGCLAGRTFSGAVRRGIHASYTVHVNRPLWDDFVTGAFDQILQNAADSQHVLETILRALDRLAGRIPTQERTRPVKMVVNNVESYIKAASFLQSDKEKLFTLIHSVREAFDRAPV